MKKKIYIGIPANALWTKPKKSISIQSRLGNARAKESRVVGRETRLLAKSRSQVRKCLRSLMARLG
jgi:hypothetical protein